VEGGFLSRDAWRLYILLVLKVAKIVGKRALIPTTKLYRTSHRLRFIQMLGFAVLLRVCVSYGNLKSNTESERLLAVLKTLVVEIPIRSTVILKSYFDWPCSCMLLLPRTSRRFPEEVEIGNWGPKWIDITMLGIPDRSGRYARRWDSNSFVIV
jgi:hypothetical protein